MKRVHVDILMATRDGASFVEEQIESIMGQSHTAFRILVRDDGSRDETPAILKSLSRRYPESISVIQLSEQSHGVVLSYDQLLRHANAQYVMFCDQDDIWLPHKIEASLERMAFLESRRGAQTPVLVHSDLKVVDKNLMRISDSFVRYQQLNPRKVELNRLLVKNVVTGCTATINRSLAQLIGKIPPDARMHDWWIALVASLFGTVEFIEEPLVLYRQHENNSIGAGPLTLKSIFARAKNISYYKSGFDKNFHQVRSLLRRYGRRMNMADKQICHNFLSLEGSAPRTVVSTIIKKRFFSHGLLRNAGLFGIMAAPWGKPPDGC